MARAFRKGFGRGIPKIIEKQEAPLGKFYPEVLRISQNSTLSDIKLRSFFNYTT